MKTLLTSILTIALTIAITLTAIFTLVRATIYVTSIADPLQRVGAVIAEIFLGIVLLLGTIWVATHFAFRIFGRKSTGLTGGHVA